MMVAIMFALAAPAWVPAGAGVEIDRSSLTWRNLQRVRWRARRNSGEERHLDMVDCAAGLTAAIETVTLDGSGRVLNVARDGEALAAQRLSPATPGTIGETVAQEACRLRPPPPRRR